VGTVTTLVPPGETIAVLTGDLIGSTGLSAQELAGTRTVLERCVRQLRPRGRVICGTPEFFRGDSWQLLVKEPRWALRVALTIRAQLFAQMGVGTRISLGMGTAEHIDTRRVSLSTGEAFTLSGRALDAMTGYFDLAGALPARAGPLERWLPALLHVISTLVRPWTRRQAQIVSMALLPDHPTHEWIAKALSPPVAKQTVSESLSGAGWRALLEAVRTFEDTDWDALLGSQATR
jgi:hypothetical protein